MRDKYNQIFEISQHSKRKSPERLWRQGLYGW